MLYDVSSGFTTVKLYSHCSMSKSQTSLYCDIKCKLSVPGGGGEKALFLEGLIHRGLQILFKKNRKSPCKWKYFAVQNISWNWLRIVSCGFVSSFRTQEGTFCWKAYFHVFFQLLLL